MMIKILHVLVLAGVVMAHASLNDRMTHGSKTLQLLAFGDSLTDGSCKVGASKHPYSIELQRLLNFHQHSAEVVQLGLSGEQVVTYMTGRLASILQNATQDGQQYDHLILMGGINDIFRKTNSSAIFAGILTMLRTAISHKMTVSLLTIMQVAPIRLDSEQAEQRTVLNHRIKLIPSNPEFTKSVTVLDLDLGLPYKESNKAGFFDDGLHLTPAGYDRLGQLVYKALIPVLKEKAGRDRVMSWVCWAFGCGSQL